MRRVNISITDEVYEAIRKLAFEERIQVGTLVKRVVEAWAWKASGTVAAAKSEVARMREVKP